MDAPKVLTKEGAKLISISSLELFQKSNYQDFARYNEVDLAIAGDGEATLPALIDACKRLITADRKRACRNAALSWPEAHKTDGGAEPATSGARLGFEPPHSGPRVRRIVAAH